MPETNPKNSRRILLSHRVFWLTAAILGFIHAWAGRHEINGDGVPYLDMGDAYLRGDWKMAINATFSPLYSWIVGFGLFVFKPSPYWEFTVVHLVNFVIYLATLASFTFFLLQLIRYWRERAQESSQSYEGLPEIGFLVLGYGLFIYSSLIWISPKIVEPDMCVAAFVYLAAGILARLRRSKTSKLNFVALGVILGFGYLAKTFVFPLAFVILLVALFLTRDRKKAVPKVVLATIVFLLLSTPFVVALSKSKGRLTIGDTGKLNYAWHVNHIESFNWQGDNPGNGIPKHPSRRIFNAPPVYEFATPVGGTYPNWYDPSYWYDGVVSRYTLREQVNSILTNLRLLGERMLDGFMVGIFTILLFLYYMSHRRRLIVKDILAGWFLFLPSIAAISMYLLIHVEIRYLAPFIVLFCLALYSSVRLPVAPRSKQVFSFATIVILVIFVLAITPSTANGAFTSLTDLIRHRDAQRNTYWQVAHGLDKIGIRPGDQVASVGGSITSSKWARLAKVKIVAEIYSFNDASAPPNDDEEKFWASDPSVKEQVMQAFAKAGAKAVITVSPPEYANLSGWQRVDGSSFYVHFLE